MIQEAEEKADEDQVLLENIEARIGFEDYLYSVMHEISNLELSMEEKKISVVDNLISNSMQARFAHLLSPRLTRAASSRATYLKPKSTATRVGFTASGIALLSGVAATLYMQQSREPIQSAAPIATIKTAAGTPGGIERTFIAVKPDGVQRGLVSEIIGRFERKGYKLVAIKSVVPSRPIAEAHYGDLRARPFFKGLVDYMTSGRAPVIAMVWEGPDVIRQGRRIIGATNPMDAQPGSIRGDFTITVGRNIIHGSDSFESATFEIGLWFDPEEVYNWRFTNEEW
ncbi:hypothetical protein HDU99_007150, partial [Rhizoclosmatium hyalinum]